MKIKSLLIALVVVGTLVAACSAQDNTVELTGTTGVDANCKMVPNTFISSAYLDLGVSNQVLVPITFRNKATSIDTSVNGNTINTVSKDFFGQELVVSYTSIPSASWATETEEQSFTVPAGAASNGSFLLADAIQPKALAQLLTMAPPPGPGAGVVLNATFKIKGKYIDGSSGESNEFTFPITVVNGGPLTCPTGQAVFGTDTTCGNLQGVPFCADAGT